MPAVSVYHLPSTKHTQVRNWSCLHTMLLLLAIQLEFSLSLGKHLNGARRQEHFFFNKFVPDGCCHSCCCRRQADAHCLIGSSYVGLLLFGASINVPLGFSGKLRRTLVCTVVDEFVCFFTTTIPTTSINKVTVAEMSLNCANNLVSNWWLRWWCSLGDDLSDLLTAVSKFKFCSLFLSWLTLKSVKVEHCLIRVHQVILGIHTKTTIWNRFKCHSLWPPPHRRAHIHFHKVPF